jgi:hypothetical protein
MKKISILVGGKAGDGIRLFMSLQDFWIDSVT